MALLTIDTSSVNCAVHLKCGDGSVYEKTDVIGRGHAEHLIGMMDAALKALCLSYQDITRLGVTLGPGSFAGIRVGLSAARGLALALDVPIAGISILRALNEEHQWNGPKLVILDAKRDEFYAEFYASDGVSNHGPMLYRLRDPLPDEWQKADYLGLIGSGGQIFQKSLPNATLLSHGAVPSIHTVARLCESAVVTTTHPKPLYLRPPDAKPQTRQDLVQRMAL